MAKIFLFRHAQTTDNLDHIFSGRRDPDLTESGLEEAGKIQEQLKSVEVTKAYCAPNTRCKHTLEIALGEHGNVEIIADPRLLERDYGELTGKNKDQYAKLYPKEYPLWHRGYEEKPPKGESLKDVENRVIPFITELIANVWQNDVILICACGNSLRPIRRHFEKMSISEMTSFEHERGKVYSYEV